MCQKCSKINGLSLRNGEEIWLTRAVAAIRDHRSRSLARNYSFVKIIHIINQRLTTKKKIPGELESRWRNVVEKGCSTILHLFHQRGVSALT
jgi:hypothetical protein